MADACLTGRVALQRRALAPTPRVTVVALAYTCSGFIVLPVVFLGRLRDAMWVVEDRQLFQAWYMKQVFARASGEG